MIVGNNFVFIHIPKCAGKYIEKQLLDQNIGKFVSGIHSPAFEIPQDHKNKKIIASIRNPWEWYVSLYFFLKQYNIQRPNECMREHMLSIWDAKHLSFEKWLEKIFNPRIWMENIDKRINWGMGKNIYCPLMKWMVFKRIDLYTARYLYLTTKENNELNGATIVNSFIRVENIIADIKKHFNIDVTSFDKVNFTPHDHYRKYYGSGTKNIIQFRCKNIIKKFHYEF